MKRVLSVGLFLASCQYAPPADNAGDEDVPIDAGSDALVDDPPGATCYGAALVRVCFAAPLTGNLSPIGPVDTDIDAACTVVEPQNGGPGLCVLAAGQVTITGNVVATGTRPLVIIADQVVSVEGTLDVSSTPGRCGAGCNFEACTIAGAGAPDGGGGGGGAGGSFGTSGGVGGLGDLNNNQPPAGSALGGTVGATATPGILRGGCSGGGGGAGGAGGDTGGTGGRGGGGVYVISNGSISISGNIYASGAGGTVSSGTAGFQDGGGGGGSGGMIGLDAPSISITGRVVANGGGGSGGGGNTGGGPGGDGSTEQWNVPAAGGTAGPTVAGPGASGTAEGAVSGIDASSADAGGGGGGGGLGVVWIDGVVSGGVMISPAPAAH